jgi:hypothetical protein
MNKLVKRIAQNGLATALVLGVIGFGFAYVAAAWISMAVGGGADRLAADEAANLEALRYRLPLAMAGGGFLVIAITEIVLYLMRGDPPEPAKKASEPAPDAAELLLEALLQEAESKQQAVGPSPSPAVSDNTPVPSPSAPG